MFRVCHSVGVPNMHMTKQCIDLFPIERNTMSPIWLLGPNASLLFTGSLDTRFSEI